MAKITKVETQKSTYQGKDKTSYIFTLDDGKSGYASNKTPWEFKEGDDVSYTVEVRKSSKGEYNLFTFTRGASSGSSSSTPPVTPQRPAIHVGSGKSKEELKVEAAVEIMKVVLSAFYEGKIETGKVAPDQREYVTLVWSEIDEVFDKK